MQPAQPLLYLPSLNLLEADYNPRLLTDKDGYDLTASLLLYGMVDALVVNQHPTRNSVIIGGHQRRRLANKIYAEGVAADMFIDTEGQPMRYPETHPLEGQPMCHPAGYVVPGCGLSEAGGLTVPCWPVSLDLQREKELNLRLNKNGGRWDMDILANQFDVSTLFEVGFTPFELGERRDIDQPDKVKELAGTEPPAPTGELPTYSPYIRVEFATVTDLQQVEAELQEVLDRLLQDNPVRLQVNLGSEGGDLAEVGPW